MKQLLISMILVLNAAMLLAVFDDYQPSARARGMGNAYTAVADDINSIFYNPAGLALTPGEINIGGANLQSRAFTQFKSAAGGYALPQKYGTVALGMRMMDVDFEDVNLMSEQIWSIGHGFALLRDIHSSIQFGYSGNLYRLRFDDTDTESAFGVDIGVLAILHRRTRFGFSVTNVNHPKMGDVNQHDLPRKLALGISYIPYEDVVTSVEVKKDFAQQTEFMAGVEYRIFDPFSIRMGVHQNPASWSAGASFYLSGISIDYSFSSHAVLDGTHYLNVGYQFQGR